MKLRSLVLILASVCSLVLSEPLQSIQKCTRPNSTSIIYHGTGEELPEIYNALTSCPNITKLDVDLHSNGCVIWIGREYFEFQEGDRFPPLKELRLGRYDLDNSLEWRWNNSRWKFTTRYMLLEYLGRLIPSLAPEDLPKPIETNLDKWIRAMDWNQLETLHLDDVQPVFYERMNAQLPGLRHLVMNVGSEGQSFNTNQTEFIRSLPPLETLSINIYAPWKYDAPKYKFRPSFPLSDILATHGPSLANLTLHQKESDDPLLPRPMLSLEDLTSIKESCPNLKHLGLDIARNETAGWPNATFNAILQIPSLETLSIGLEIGADLHQSEPGEYSWNYEGLTGSGPWREPRMSLEVAEQLFRGFEERKSGEKLKEVLFTVGDWTDEAYTGPIYMPSWEEGRARRFLCRADRPVGSRCAGLDERERYYGDLDLDSPEEQLRLTEMEDIQL